MAQELNATKPAPGGARAPSADDKSVAELVSRIYPSLNETLEAVALGGDGGEIFKVAISELVSKLSTQSGIKYLVLDGIITQRLLEGAKKADVEYVVGHRIAKLTNAKGITLRTFGELDIS